MPPTLDALLGLSRCPIVAQELVQPGTQKAPNSATGEPALGRSSGESVYSSSDDALVAQELRPIPRDVEFLAAARKLPHEPAASHTDPAHLEWEYTEIKGFLAKVLRKDPRAKPANIVVDDSHLNLCTSCARMHSICGSNAWTRARARAHAHKHALKRK